MIFADAEFYTSNFLHGRAAVIPLDEFSFWAMQASQLINRNNVTLDDIPDYLSMAVCEAAEVLYRAEMSAGTPDNPVKSSESVGRYSVSYSVKTRSESEINLSIRKIIIKWLADTELHNLFVFIGVKI